LNIALIGFGRFGKIYYKNLISLKLFKKIIIYRKKNNKKFERLTKNSLKKNNIDLAIVATPVDTHFKIASLLIKNKIPIILEKPAARNLLQIYKLKKISLENKTSVLINYSDLYNENFLKIIKHKNKFGKINFFKINFGKYNGNYNKKNFQPYFDWFPHIFAVVHTLFEEIKDIRIINFSAIKKKNFYFQSISIKFHLFKNFYGNIYFSNNKRKKERKFLIKSYNSKILYDGYNDTNNYMKINNKILKLAKAEFTPMKNIILKLYKLRKNNKYYSNFDLSIKVHKTLNKINFLLSKKN